MKREVRSIGLVEVRTAEDSASKRLGGYAARFNSQTEIAGYFLEQIALGAFRSAIGRDDVRALFNHDPNFVLARTTNGTLQLSEDADGLAFDLEPIDTTWSRDLQASVARGDISQCSFAFMATREEWDQSGELPLRTIVEADLFDVSVVTYPAYDDTSVGVRSLSEWRATQIMPATPIKQSVAARSRLLMLHGLRVRGLGARQTL